MKRTLIISVAVILIIVIGAATVFISYTASNKKPFYVGVTFGGSTAEEAKVLIEKVKDYTNLFVVQSNSLQWNITELEEACDYAVDSGLDIIVYFGYHSPEPNPSTNEFINTAPERYGSHFLGVYYGDEPAGKMLDSPRHLTTVFQIGRASCRERVCQYV
jgi:2',3'-cyclic-nucleotide 2'-phosphodiesterase (5'-nucleotidase family)